MFYRTHFEKHCMIQFSLQFYNLVYQLILLLGWIGLFVQVEFFMLIFQVASVFFIEIPEVVIVKISYKSIISVATLFPSYLSIFTLFL